MPITHNSFVIPGLVEDLQWGEWERPAQYSSVFGQPGVTVLDGKRKLREFVAPMLIFNSYISEAALDAALANLDAKTGQVGTYIERDLSANIKRTLTNVEFAGLIVRIKRYDSDLGWWGRCALRFRQLKPPN